MTNISACSFGTGLDASTIRLLAGEIAKLSSSERRSSRMTENEKQQADVRFVMEFCGLQFHEKAWDVNIEGRTTLEEFLQVTCST